MAKLICPFYPTKINQMKGSSKTTKVAENFILRFVHIKRNGKYMSCGKSSNHASKTICCCVSELISVGVDFKSQDTVYISISQYYGDISVFIFHFYCCLITHIEVYM